MDTIDHLAKLTPIQQERKATLMPIKSNEGIRVDK